MEHILPIYDCIEVWEIFRWCQEHDVILRICHIPEKFNILVDRLLRLDKPQYRLVLGTNSGKLYFSNAQISQFGFVCNSIQSQTPIVSIVPDNQALVIDALSMNWNNLHAYALLPTVHITICSHQNPTVLVQNRSNCSSLASTSLVLRGVTATSNSPI